MSAAAVAPRLADRLVAAVALVVLSPLLAVAGLGIKLSSRGPVLYAAPRVGLHGQAFTMYKLRTMRLSTGERARLTSGSDPRVFPWGAALRRLKIDELPQLVNIVRGEMAIVGPRPEDPAIVSSGYAEWMMETLSVSPGLTSPGSLDYFAEERDLPDDPETLEAIYLKRLLPKKLAADVVYVRNRNLAYDVQLVMRTLLSLVGLRSAFADARASERREAAALLARVGS